MKPDPSTFQDRRKAAVTLDEALALVAEIITGDRFRGTIDELVHPGVGMQVVVNIAQDNQGRYSVRLKSHTVGTKVAILSLDHMAPEPPTTE